MTSTASRPSLTVHRSRLVRPRKDRARNREALLDAGQVVFGRHGVAAPLETVAETAGLSSATLYRHFESREHLLVEVYTRTLADVVAVGCALDGDGDPWATFVELASWMFDRLSTDLTLVRALVTTSNGAHPEFAGYRARARHALQETVERAMAVGRFRDDRSSEDVLLYLTAAEALAERGETIGPRWHRLFALMIDSVENR